MSILRPVLWSAVLVAGGLVAAASIIAGEGVDAVAFVVAQVAAFGGAGAFLIGRLPHNPIGWLLGWYGLNFSREPDRPICAAVARTRRSRRSP